MLQGDISPDTISSIKVSPRSPPTVHGSSHVVVIHNRDYQDTAQVSRQVTEALTRCLRAGYEGRERVEECWGSG